MPKPLALVAVTATELVLLDPKLGSATAPTRTSLASPLAAVCDGTSVYIASAGGVAKYNRESGTHLFSFSDDALPVCALAAQNGVVCVARDMLVDVYQAGAVAPSETLGGHASPVTSLALSHDGAMLASASRTLHVYDLASSARTILRGLPSDSTTCNMVKFHPTREHTLLSVFGRQLLVHNRLAPDAPVSALQVGSGSRGDIVDIDCSPFSHSLIAVASAGGLIGIVDLDKEKLLVKTIDTKAQLSSIRFQPDAPFVVVGTQDGRVLNYDLRAADKQPQSCTVDKRGNRITHLAWLQTTKTPSGTKVRTISAKAGASVKQPAAGKPSTSRSDATLVSPKTKTGSPTAPSTSRVALKGVFSPAKRPPGDRDQPKPAADAAVRLARQAKENVPAARPLSPKLAAVQKLAAARSDGRRVSTSDVLSKRRVSTTTASSMARNTPSPSLPSPLAAHLSPPRKQLQRQALGLGTPGRTRANTAPSTSPSKHSGESSSASIPASLAESVTGADTDQDTDTIMLPTRSRQRKEERIPSVASDAESISTARAHMMFEDHQLSPTRRNQRPISPDFSPTKAAFSSAPPAMLRAIMQELATKDDIKGLHMDLIRMGAAWRSEMRQMSEMYAGDMAGLRDENERLRKELERLRGHV